MPGSKRCASVLAMHEVVANADSQCQTKADNAMKGGIWVWVVVGALAVVAAGFAIGRASSGIERVSGSEFLKYADQIGMVQSVLNVRLIGVTDSGVYLEYWRGVRILATKNTVIWTPLSELPADVVQKLKQGKNPWEKK